MAGMGPIHVYRRPRFVRSAMGAGSASRGSQRCASLDLDLLLDARFGPLSLRSAHTSGLDDTQKGLYKECVSVHLLLYFLATRHSRDGRVRSCSTGTPQGHSQRGAVRTPRQIINSY
ncbi:hypothetical protein H6P81_016345 [Aristolochia fimbriata]|uniref:Uncharacterized protein n=1 Tax=Aristolochia fimbriata TaxID=158543 RepID=A0AAV7E7Z4_ARIFI|nr:hypothetical protein H6P81_016345 [Aristolochia fimbriata]